MQPGLPSAEAAVAGAGPIAADVFALPSYCQEGRGLPRHRRRRRVGVDRRLGLPEPVQRNESWGVDFTSDQPYSARPIWVLAMADTFSRESLARQVDLRLTGDDAVEVLNGLIRERARPRSLRVDSGAELTSRVVHQWT